MFTRKALEVTSQHGLHLTDRCVCVCVCVCCQRCQCAPPQVLRFYAYFQEAVHEKREEKYRIRRCTIYFYLEDDTIQVNEPNVANSGIPQGLPPSGC